MRFSSLNSKRPCPSLLGVPPLDGGELDGSAVRNSSGTNPLTLQQAAEPRIGSNWKVTLNCSGRGPGPAYLAGCGAPLAGLLTPAGELPVDALASPRIFRFIAAHTGTSVPFVSLIPRDVSLVGREMFVQGLCTSATGAKHGNALDVVIGR